MNVIITLNIIVILTSYFARFKNVKYMLEISFLIIFFFTAFRYNFGTDYSTYYEVFIAYNSLTLSEILDNSLGVEIGWVIINRFFNFFGFFGLIFAISAYFCYSYYSLIKKYVAVNYYWFAVLLYVFTFEIMMIQFSAIRQALAIAIFINSIKYLIEKKKPTKYLAMILFASLIHTSALIMLPFVFFTLIKKHNYNITGYYIILLFLFLIFFGNTVFQYFPQLLAISTGAKYLNNLDAEISGALTYSGIIFWTLLCLTTFYYSLKQKNNIKILFYFVLFYYIVYTLINLIWLVNRIGFYFAPITIVVYPLILQNEKKQWLKILISILFILSIFNQFSKYQILEWVISGYTNYQTIFSVW